MKAKIFNELATFAKKFAGKTAKFAKQHKASIYTGTSVALGVVGMIEVHKAEPKALSVLQQDLERKALDPNDDRITPDEFYEGVDIKDIRGYFTFKERAKLTWPYYISPVGCAAGAIATGGASIVTGEKTVAGLTAACKLAEKTNEILREETEKAVGKEKAEEIQKTVAEKVSETEESKKVHDLDPEDKLIPFKDTVTGVEFMSTEYGVKMAFLDVEKHIYANDFCNLSDLIYFYSEHSPTPLEASKLSSSSWFDQNHHPDYYFGDGHWNDGTPCRTINYPYCIHNGTASY